MLSKLQKAQRSISLKKFTSSSNDRFLTPEKSKQSVRNSNKNLKSSKFSRMFAKRNHADVVLSNYRDIGFRSKVKRQNTLSSSMEKYSCEMQRPISGKIVVKRQRALENFDQLIEKCESVKKSCDLTDVITGEKAVNGDIGRLRKTIEMFQNVNDNKLHYSKTEKMLKSDSKKLRGQIGYSERHKNKGSCIWKQRSGFLNRKTDKLIAQVAIRLKHTEAFG